MAINKPTNTGCCPTATHIGYLAGMLAKTTGPVVELGTGHYSTPLLHYICQGRQIVSVDTDIEWWSFFSDRYQNDTHKFVYTDNALISKFFFSDDAFNGIYWDVAFVDNSPSADRRRCIEKLRDRAKFIVVHDTELNAEAYGWGKEGNSIFDSFKYSFHCPFFNDRTSVVSDVEDIGLI